MPKLLIIEDNEENRDAIGRRLKRRGFDIIMAVDGEQGVAMSKSKKPDLILMDMNMPIMDGWHAARLIRNDMATQNIPIVGLTAHAIAGDREKALEAGCSDYHTKPVEFALLMTQIEFLLKNALQP